MSPSLYENFILDTVEISLILINLSSAGSRLDRQVDSQLLTFVYFVYVSLLLGQPKLNFF